MSPLSLYYDDTSMCSCSNSSMEDVDVSLSASSSSSLTSRGVSFASSVAVYEHIHLSEYSEEEKHASWYNGEEIKTIKSHTLAEATLMARGHAETPNVTCYRGLEYKTKQAALKRRHIRIDAKAAVFLEQEMQREDEIVDAQAIGSAYLNVTKASQIKAHKMGLEDEQQVKNIRMADCENLLMQRLGLPLSSILGKASIHQASFDRVPSVPKTTVNSAMAA
jgi:hypothetical protein